MPPLLGTADASELADITFDSADGGTCSGTGTVRVSFDGGAGQTTCWAAFGYVSKTSATVTLSGNVTTTPGLAGGTICSLGPGSKVPLDSPCFAIVASYISSANQDVWQAFGGTGPGATVLAHGTDAGPMGTVTLTSFGDSLGNSVSVEFSTDAKLVVNQPGFPLAAISGSVTASIE
jgi:hypothetical protein